ncbi:MAG: YHS domain-containing protein [Candidatus Manganitrophaceae bacterium]|nr:MAG: YHS domain-containing protein [Candidatus Manganitrophaceae bacterium]
MMRMGGCGGGGHDNRSDDRQRQGGTAKSRLKDPVCGMEVEAAKAKTSVFVGRTYYFCSNDCREKFEADPASYAGKERSGGGC